MTLIRMVFGLSCLIAAAPAFGASSPVTYYAATTDGSKVYRLETVADQGSVTTRIVKARDVVVGWSTGMAMTPDAETIVVPLNGNGPTAIVHFMRGNGMIDHTYALGNAGIARMRPGSSEVWIADVNGSSVWIFDAPTSSLVRQFSVSGGYGIRHLTFSPDGAAAYISTYNYANISVVDANTLQTTHVLDTPYGQADVPVVASPDGLYLYVSSYNGLNIFETSNYTLVLVNDRVGPVCAVSPDGATMYTNAVSAHDTQAVFSGLDGLKASTPLVNVRDVALTPDGRYLYAAPLYDLLSILDASTLALVETTAIAGPMAVAVAGGP